MMLNSQFIVQNKIGQALYGDVWLCEDARRDNTLVAVKQVSLQRAKLALTANRHLDNPFEERRIAYYLSQLHRGGHENILQFQNEFLENGCWYMVTEYCDGGDLLARLELAPQNKFAENVALKYFQQVAQGVHFLHESGVAHRDLSLENVLLKNGVCKVCDFGLATTTDNITKERVGKAYYMAPEVVAEQEYDPMAADMWSLGIMLFIMLTGSPLVATASRSEKAFLALETFGVEKILDVWGMASSVSPAARDLLSGLLQVRPEKRMSAMEVLEHIALGRL